MFLTLLSQMSVYKSIISFINAHKTSTSSAPPTVSAHKWRQKLSRLLESHPHLANEDSTDEDSQGLERNQGGSTPEEIDFSLSSSEGEEDEDEEEGVAGGVVIPEKSTRDVIVMQRKKSKVRYVI